MGRNRFRALVNALSLCAPLVLGGCKMAIMDPKGQIGETEKGLIIISFLLMLLVVVPVIVLTIVTAYKYRASNPNADYQPGWSHSLKIEAVVWGIPCLIVLVLSTICWQSTHALDPGRPLVSNVKPLEIEVVSLDWKWLFIYPEQHIATINEIAIPVNRPIKFVVTSDTVMNSFFIPQLGSQIYAMTGMEARLNLVANEPGTFRGISANFSGQGFSGMSFQTLAVTDADFDQWVAKAQKSDDKLDASTFKALEEPSEENAAHYYASVDDGLFDSIVSKYMDMPTTKNGTMMGMEEGKGAANGQ